MKAGFKYFVFLLLFTSIANSIFSQKVNWEQANAYTKDNKSISGLIKSGKSSYWSYIKLKQGEKIDYLYPEDINEIRTENHRFIKVEYYQEEYNNRFFSFGYVLGGNDICLVKSRVFHYVCNCNSGTRYLNAFFIKFPDKDVMVHTGPKKSVISNIPELQYDFSNYDISITKEDLSTIENLIIFLNKL